MDAGDPAPQFWSTEPGQVVVGWVLRGGDLIRCETEATVLRALTRQHGARVRVSVVAVDTDSALVASFFRTERLPAELTLVTRDEFRGQFGTTALPALYLVRNDTVTEVVPGSGREETTQRLREAVQRALHASGRFTGSADPSPFSPTGATS